MCEAANEIVGTLVILQPASVTCYHSGDPGPKAWSRTTCSMSKLNQIEDTISSMFPRLSSICWTSLHDPRGARSCGREFKSVTASKKHVSDLPIRSI